MQKSIIIIACATILAMPSAHVSAGLMGDTVTSSVEPSSIWSSDPTSAVVGIGPEFELLLGTGLRRFFEIDVDNDGFNFDYVDSGSLDAGASEVYTLGDLDWIGIPSGQVVGVDVTIFGNPSGITSSDVSFTSDSVSINFDGFWNPNQGQGIRVDLVTEHAAVPEPASLVMFAMGALSMTGIRRRRKNRSTRFTSQ